MGALANKIISNHFMWAVYDVHAVPLYSLTICNYTFVSATHNYYSDLAQSRSTHKLYISTRRAQVDVIQTIDSDELVGYT